MAILHKNVRFLKFAVIICGAVVWCFCLVSIARVGTIKEAHSPYAPHDHAFWYMVAGSLILLSIVASLVFSKRRLLVLSLISFLVASALGSFWYASRTAYQGMSVGWGGPIWVNDVKFFEGAGVHARIARGGMLLDFHVRSIAWSDNEHAALDYARLIWGVSSNSGSVYYPTLPEITGRGPVATPLSAVRWRGFEACWFVSQMPPAARGMSDQVLVGLVCPIWLPVLLCVVAPAFHTRALLRERRRLKRGLCRCGFDLRAHKAGECCPECGAAIPGSHKGTEVAGVPGAGGRGGAKSEG